MNVRPCATTSAESGIDTQPPVASVDTEPVISDVALLVEIDSEVIEPVPVISPEPAKSTLEVDSITPLTVISPTALLVIIGATAIEASPTLIATPICSTSE